MIPTLISLVNKQTLKKISITMLFLIVIFHYFEVIISFVDVTAVIMVIIVNVIRIKGAYFIKATDWAFF